MELFGKKQVMAGSHILLKNTKPIFELNFVGRNVFLRKRGLNNLTFTYLNWATHIQTTPLEFYNAEKGGFFEE